MVGLQTSLQFGLRGLFSLREEKTELNVGKQKEGEGGEGVMEGVIVSR